MFLGDFKQKKSINLGGNSSKLSKQELLLKTQREREQRQRQKLQATTALKIQSWFRGRCSNYKEKVKARSNYQLMYGNEFNANLNVDLKKKMSLFVFFYHKNVDTASFNELALEALTVDKKLGVALLIAPLYNTNSDSLTYVHTLRKFTKIVLENLLLDYSQLDVMLKILKVLIESDDKINEKLSLLIKKNVERCGFFKTVKDFVLTKKNSYLNFDNDVNTLFDFTINVASKFTIENNSSVDKSFVIRSFTLNILSIPLLLSKFKLQGNLDSVAHIMKSIFQFLISDTFTFNNDMQYLYILSNILEFGLRLNYNEEETITYMESLIKLLKSIPREFMKIKMQTVSGTNSGGKDMDLMEVDSGTTIDRDLISSISIIYSQEHLRKLLTPILSNKNDESHNDIIIRGLGKFSELILLIIFKYQSSIKVEIFRILMYKFKDLNLLKTYWIYFKKGDLIKFFLVENIFENIFLKFEKLYEWFLFLVFLEILQRFLLVLGDDEFFKGELLGNGSPEGVKEFVVLCTILKNLTFFILTNLNISNLLKEELKLSSNLLFGLVKFNFIKFRLITTLQQLYTRDCRRSFFPKNQ
ncbi:hypothetical protein HK099_003445, partial [Clydaea vesicula]